MRPGLDTVRVSIATCDFGERYATRGASHGGSISQHGGSACFAAVASPLFAAVAFAAVAVAARRFGGKPPC
jgi:hypothetical protein